MSRHFRTVKPRFWVLLIGALALTCVVLYSSQERFLGQQRDMIQSLEDEYQKSVDNNASLQHKIEFTQTDEYIEREARSKLGLVKEGEILYKTND